MKYLTWQHRNSAWEWFSKFPAPWLTQKLLCWGILHPLAEKHHFSSSMLSPFLLLIVSLPPETQRHHTDPPALLLPRDQCRFPWLTWLSYQNALKFLCRRGSIDKNSKFTRIVWGWQRDTALCWPKQQVLAFPGSMTCTGTATVIEACTDMGRALSARVVTELNSWQLLVNRLTLCQKSLRSSRKRKKFTGCICFQKIPGNYSDKCLGEVFPRDVDGLKVGCGQGSPMRELRV